MRFAGKFCLGLGLILIAAAAGLWFFRDPVLEKFLEAWLNRTQNLFFAGTLDLQNVHLDRQFRLKVGQVTGDWQTLQGPFPVEVHEIYMQDSLLDIVRQNPVRITFDRFRPQGSSREGVRGRAVLNQTGAGTFHLEADFVSLTLEEMEGLDPESLRGASGAMTGHLVLKTTAADDQTFRVDLSVPEPGGRVQARFFDILLPYLPGTQKKALEAIRGLDTVKYRKADFEAELEEPGAIKMLLRILVPDYNLHLNLNLKIRVEDQESFLKLIQVLGMVRVEVK